jgi:FkbM family methyltransferase
MADEYNGNVSLHEIDTKLDAILQRIDELVDVRTDSYGVTSTTLNVLHNALFGWPMDDLTPKSDLFALGTLREAAMVLLASKRFKYDSRADLPLWPSDKWICTEAFGLKIWVNLHDNFVSWGVLREEWENADVDFALRLLQEGDAMVDIGANVGVYALQAARKVGSSGLVYAFEPQPDVCAMLRRSAADNGLYSRMIIAQSGVGAEDKEARIWRHDYKNQGASRIASDEEVTGGASASVDLVRLDSVKFRKRIKFVKADIEGYEPLMLVGGQQFFREHKPVVLTEFFPRAIREIARIEPAAYLAQWYDLGYSVHHFDEGEIKRPVETANHGLYESQTALFNIVCFPDGALPKQF